jgi:hypothetical protein
VTNLLARKTLLDAEKKRAAGTKEIETQTPLIRSSMLSSALNRAERKTAVGALAGELGALSTLAKPRSLSVGGEPDSDPLSVLQSGAATPFPSLTRRITPGMSAGLQGVVSALQSQTTQAAGSTSNVDFS